MSEFDYSKLKYCGVDVRIGSNVIIRNPELVSIGDHVAIDSFCYFTTALEIGNYIHIAPYVSIIGGRKAFCKLEDFTGIAAGSRLICGSDDFLGSGLTNPTIPEKYHADLIFAPIVLEKHALVGTNCVIHPGATIHEGAAVGSCSLVTKSLDAWMIYTGIPARAVKDREKENILRLEAQLRADIG
jgi:dTDP-4-amino-4,6-dideoxy-D-glucose acyltransferase